MNSSKRQYDLEQRLIDFAVKIIELAESLPNTRLSNHIRSQIFRCGTSPPANYAEAQSAESRSDFIHKIKIVTKEIRETRVWLVIIERASLSTKSHQLQSLIKESNELISIFVKSSKTAKANLKSLAR